jgi:hypothetical protein
VTPKEVLELASIPSAKPDLGIGDSGKPTGPIGRGTHQHAQGRATRPRLWCRYTSVAHDR